jgi:hypothetical protein
VSAQGAQRARPTRHVSLGTPPWARAPCQGWSRNTYDKCVDLQVPDIQGTRAIFDFLKVINRDFGQFAGFWKNQITLMEETPGVTVPNMDSMIKFSNHYKQVLLTSGKTTATFASTYQNRTTDGREVDADTEADKEKKKMTDKKKSCFCGEDYTFRNCNYLIPSIRPNGWSADPEVKKRFDEAYAAAPDWLKAVADRAVKQLKEKGEKRGNDVKSSHIGERLRAGFASAGLVSAFHSLDPQSIPDYELRDSFILDSGASSHIINQGHRFINYDELAKPRYMYAGSHLDAIYGYGDLEITVKIPSGNQILLLRYVAHVLTYQINIVSFCILKKKGVRWDTQNNCLTLEGTLLALVQDREDQFVLEYNKLGSIATFASSKKKSPKQSAKPRVSEADVMT